MLSRHVTRNAIIIYVSAPNGAVVVCTLALSSIHLLESFTPLVLLDTHGGIPLSSGLTNGLISVDQYFNN